MSQYATVDELKASDEWQQAGIVKRQNLLVEHFGDEYRANSSAHLMEVAYAEEDINAE